MLIFNKSEREEKNKIKKNKRQRAGEEKERDNIGKEEGKSRWIKINRKRREGRQEERTEEGKII